MRVLVTGATGFVGQALLPLLLEGGCAVRAAVRRQPLAAAGVESVVVGDIGPATEWAAALADVDAIVHMAARVHVMRDDVGDPHAAYRATNTFGTLRLAEAAAQAGVRRFVFLSTVKVNGDRTFPGRPFVDGDPPAPADAYAISKAEAESGLLRMAQAGLLEPVILRPPLVYGPGVGANFLRLLRLADHALPLPLAAIDNRRSMIYVGNLASAIVAALHAPGLGGRTFLLADGDDLSTPQLWRQLAKALGRPARLWPLPACLLCGMATLLGRRAEIDRLTGSLAVDAGGWREASGWLPPFTVAQGIARTVAWYRGMQHRQ
jgi:nucleoside-diphosphate-sugar epimerase